MTKPIAYQEQTLSALVPAENTSPQREVKLPQDILKKIFSFAEPLMAGNAISLVCWTFKLLFDRPIVAYFHLENELEMVTTLDREQIESYRTRFRKKHGKELSYEAFFSKCPQLTHLNFSFSGLSGIDDAKLAAILKAVRQCPLQTLNLYGSLGITKWPDLTGLDKLHTLNLGCCYSLTGEVDLKGLPELRHLDLKNSKITKLHNLDQLHKLEILDLSQCYFIEALDFDGLGALQKLKLFGCMKLKKLDHLDQLNNLKWLDLRATQMEGALDLSGLDKLETLYLKGSKKIIGLLELHRLHSLKTFYFTSCNFHRLDLTGLNALEFLDVSNSPHLRELPNIYKCRQLKELHRTGCEELPELDASRLPAGVVILSGN